MPFITAKEGPPNVGSTIYTVQYFDENGNMVIRSDGSKAWRNNNPGNMVYNSRGFAAGHGAIGSAGGMAVFPYESTGRQALIALLKLLTIKSFQFLIYLKNMINIMRPSIDMLLSISKLDPNKLIKHLSIEEFERLHTAIERIEGWKEGHEDFIPKWIISGVHKKRGVITEYLVCINQESIWLPKQEAIKWTLEGKLHAILVHMKNGNHYLRPEHGQHSFVAIT